MPKRSLFLLICFVVSSNFLVASPPEKIEQFSQERKLGAHSNSVFSLALSPDGKYMVSVSADRQIVLWEVGKWNPVNINRDARGNMLDVQFSFDGRHVLAGGDPSEVLVMEVPSMKLVKRMKFQHRPKRLATHPSKTWVAVGGSRTGQAFVKNYLTGELIMTCSGHKSTVFGVTFSSRGNLLYTAGDSERGGYHVQAFILAQRNRPILLGSVTDEPIRMHLSADGKYLCLATKKKVLLIHPTSRRVVAVWQPPGSGNTLDFVHWPERDLFVSATDQGQLHFWQTQSSAAIKKVSAAKVHLYQILPLGKDRLITCARQRNNAISVWNLSERVNVVANPQPKPDPKKQKPNTSKPSTNKNPQDLSTVLPAYKKVVFRKFRKTKFGNADIEVMQNGKPRMLHVIATPTVYKAYQPNGTEVKDLFKAVGLLRVGLVADIRTTIRMDMIFISELRVLGR